MSTDLKDQVRAYTRYFIETIDPVELDEIVGGPEITRPATPVRGGWRVSRWAIGLGVALAVLLILGGTAVAIWLFAGTGEREVAEQPTTTVTVPAADDRGFISVVDGWQRIDDPWFENGLGSDNLEIEALPGGGFIAASGFEHPDGSRVMWSPDGFNWFDGDPQRLLPTARDMAVVADQVIILAGDDATPTLWTGHPKTGHWAPMLHLDTSGLERRPVPGSFGMAAGKDAVLVTAVTRTDDNSPLGRIGSFVVWRVDPEYQTATRMASPVRPPANQEGWGTEWEGGWLTWFDGRWHVMLSWGGGEDWNWIEHVLWSSPNGTTWIEEKLPAGWRTPMLNFPTVGSSGIVTCAAIDGNQETAGTWFSPDGTDWRPVGVSFCRGVYSDSLGFVSDAEFAFGSDDGPALYQLSPDGTTLGVWTSQFPFDVVAASGNNLIVHAFRGSEHSAEEAAEYAGLWLIHLPGDE